mmetsp:Transcript_2666/g.4347  ORF Transcript_2666/g.4347 Transcript_2666/m.4347 type:complete len:245 (+) Transcript_2666:854-1588(+)
MKLVFVFHHLGSLPIVLDACSLKRELFDFDRDWTTSLSFDNGNVIFRLTPIHIHHPRLSNNPPNHHILRLPILRRIRSPSLLRIILDHMLPLRHNNLSFGNIKQQWQRTGSLLNQTRCLLWILDINPIHLEEDMAQFHSRGASTGPFNNKGNDGTFFERIHHLLISLKKKRINKFLGFKEHNSKCGCKDFGIVPFSSGGELSLFTTGRTCRDCLCSIEGCGSSCLGGLGLLIGTSGGCTDSTVE